MYNITVSEEELQMVGGLEQQWKDLSAQGREVDRSLIKVKKKFTLVCNLICWKYRCWYSRAYVS